MAAAADLQVLIQQFQKLSEDEFKEEDTNVFLVTCQKCLEEEELEVLLDIIKDEKNQTLIRHMGWNLIGPITKCMQSCELGSEKESDCLQMIDGLIQSCNPKEILLGILEQIDEAAWDNMSRIILPLLQPLQIVLLKLGNKKSYSVGLSLSTLHSQLSSLPVPYTTEQMQEDKHSLCQCCLALVQFAQPFIDIVSQNVDISKEPDIQEMRKELLTFCFSCLKFPLLSAQLNLLPEDEDDNLFLVFAKEIMGFLVSLGESLPRTFVQRSHSAQTVDTEGSVPEKETYTAESVACLSYLLFVHHIGMDSFPFVFGPSFLVKSNMEHVDVLLKSSLYVPSWLASNHSFLPTAGLVDQDSKHSLCFCFLFFLIKRTEESMLSKGLDLLEHSFLRVDNESLPEDVLDVLAVNQVLQDLVKVMTLCPIEHLRKKSLAMLQLVIDKFCVEGKYKLFRCLLKISGHAGVEGYIIHNIKNQIDAILKSNLQNKWFLGTRLAPLLHLALSLPEGAETDLLQTSDRIMASLNLLRYLVIKDNDDETGVWRELAKIEQDFLKPLHTGLNMSRAHYEAEMRRTSEKKKGSHSEKSLCTVTAGGNTLPDMTPEMQLQVLQSALFTFDLMESILARVEELIEVKLKSAPEEKIGSSKDV
ncbi:glomulin isoform X1 [Rhinoderma darwinii]|uniref:glomulin isoform X1 n=1 Tax=Rhinoderma darwinii TaxID=43563 RepID=UPI003F67FFFF